MVAVRARSFKGTDAWYTIRMPEEIRISGFTKGELKAASFWVRNGALLRRIGYGTLIGLAALFWGYSLWGILDAYAISYPRESRITHDIAVNQQLLASLQTEMPQNLSTSNVSVYTTTDSRLDMSVEVTNPNDHWWVEFNYRFNVSGELTPMQKGYVLPSSKQIITELGWTPTQKGGRTATLVVDNVRWHRLDPTQVQGPYSEYAQKRLDVTFDDLKYDTDIQIGNKRVGQTSFTLDNHSGYGYWGLDLILRLYRGNSIVAINKITLDKVSPGEKRPVQVVWFENLPSITKTEIIPQVNLLDAGAFLPTQYFQIFTTTSTTSTTP